VHAEHATPEGGHDPGGYGERAETYVRLLAESVLRGSTARDADCVRRAAEILVEAGLLTDELAARILADLQLALRVRAMPPARTMATRLRRLKGFQAVHDLEPGGPPRSWRVFPGGQSTPGSRPMALIILADRALALATLFFPPDGGPLGPGVPPFGLLTGTDDMGTGYRLAFTDGNWAGSAWTGTVMLLPAPPPAARWLALNSPNGQVLRADITAAARGGATPVVALEHAAESPGERLLSRQAEAMLAALTLSYPAGHSRPSLAELVATLEAAGALSPLSPAPARLAALGQLLGLPTHGPADQVPARWKEVMAYYGRRRRPAPLTGTGAIAADLPELDGVRLAIAGLRSGGSGSFLHVLVTGLGPLPRRRPPGPPWDAGLSWWVRDDAGGWHLGVVEDVNPVGGPEGVLRLELLPPLGHATTTLTVEITGIARQMTAILPVHW
jgi:hypothetical protein